LKNENSGTVVCYPRSMASRGARLGGPRSDKHNDDRQRTIALAQGRGNAGSFPVAGSREQNVDVKVDVVPTA
jgi:hypothetical protein